MPDNGMDIVLLSDIFHDLDDSTSVLVELQRTLKPDGLLHSRIVAGENKI